MPEGGLCQTADLDLPEVCHTVVGVAEESAAALGSVDLVSNWGRNRTAAAVSDAAKVVADHRIAVKIAAGWEVETGVAVEKGSLASHMGPRWCSHNSASEVWLFVSHVVLTRHRHSSRDLHIL